MKICFHVDENSRWQVALANVRNTFNYFKENKLEGEIVVIANAEAVVYLSKDHIAEAMCEELDHFISEGVAFFACRNALKGNMIEESRLVKGVEVVPAGIIALAEKQGEGFAYIRP